MERQIASLLFDRLQKSRDREGVLALANEGMQAVQPVDVIKDPYVLEFLNLPEAHRMTESHLEEALLTQLHDFLLELGSGFAYVGRQVRLTLDGDHFYPSLVFYHIKLKCYVVIDLKLGKLSHADFGQMQLRSSSERSQKQAVKINTVRSSVPIFLLPIIFVFLYSLSRQQTLTKTPCVQPHWSIRVDYRKAAIIVSQPRPKMVIKSSS